MGCPLSRRGSRTNVVSRRPGERFTAARISVSERRYVERIFAVFSDTQESQ